MQQPGVISHQASAGRPGTGAGGPGAHRGVPQGRGGRSTAQVLRPREDQDERRPWPRPTAGSSALAVERPELPRDDGVARAQVAQGLGVPVADRPLVDRTHERAPDQPLEREPTGVVQRDHELDARQDDVEPGAVRRVEDPGLLGNHLVEQLPLSLPVDRDPAGKPGQLVGQRQRKAGARRDPRGRGGLAAAGDPVDEDALRGERIGRDGHTGMLPTGVRPPRVHAGHRGSIPPVLHGPTDPEEERRDPGGPLHPAHLGW